MNFYVFLQLLILKFIAQNALVLVAIYADIFYFTFRLVNFDLNQVLNVAILLNKMSDLEQQLIFAVFFTARHQ